MLPKGVAWSDDAITRALLITYFRRYNPSAGGGARQWENDSVADDISRDPNRDREVFFRRGGGWYYYGTYRCVGHSEQVALDGAKIWKNVCIIRFYRPEALSIQCSLGGRPSDERDSN